MRPPNIILVNCDDLGYGDCGCYGSCANHTPHIDRCAREGMRFTDFYMPSPLCSPSRGAMMTGCYPPRIGFGLFDGRGVLFPGQAVGLDQKETTLGSLLKKAGYATKMVGKWHCGDQPAFLPDKHGFDDYYGLPYSNDMGRQATYPDRPPLPLLRNSEVIQQQPDQAGLTERYTEEACRFIRTHAHHPFFLYLAHMYVHLPIFLTDTFRRQSTNGAYGGAVACIDWSLGVLMHELSELGLDRDTVLIFTSDNGSRARNEGGSNAPLRGHKGQTWEGGMRVPCIVRWPGTIPANTVCRRLATAMDFLPTFARMAGTALPEYPLIDGKDISPLLSDPHAPSPHTAFFYYKKNTLEAVRQGKWKLHVRKDDEPLHALFDLENDAGEQHDLFATHPAIVRSLRARLDTCARELGDDASGMEGTGTRPIGRVDTPVALTTYDPDHPYMVAMYDLPDSEKMSG